MVIRVYPILEDIKTLKHYGVSKYHLVSEVNFYMPVSYLNSGAVVEPVYDTIYLLERYIYHDSSSL